MPDVVVVGAGLSGLACAWQLGRSGIEVLVLDRAREPGGVVRSHQIDGFLVESGPNTLLPAEGTGTLIREAGIASEIVTAPKGLPRFIYVGGRLRKVPWVLSPRGIARALVEPLVPRRPGERDESVAGFATRRFGRQAHDRLVAPFVGGIYAGDTEQLGVEGAFPRLAALERRYGSVILGFLRSPGSRPRPVLSSFRKGMATLPQSLASQTNLCLGVPEVRVSSGAAGHWQVDSSRGALAPRAVVLAVPAYAVRGCFADPVLGELLSAVDYAPVLVAAAAFDRSQFDAVPRGFGFLVPRAEGLRVLGALFSSGIFPGRAPEGKVLLTAFLGGALDREVPEWPDTRVWETLDLELRQVLGFRGSLRPIGLHRYPRGIPQYPIGHRLWRHRVCDRLNDLGGLFLTGNYLDGVSVPLTLEHGRKTAGAVRRYLESKS